MTVNKIEKIEEFLLKCKFPNFRINPTFLERRQGLGYEEILIPSNKDALKELFRNKKVKK